MMSDFENDLPPVLESKPAPAPPPPSTSLLARLLNILAIPGQVFEEVRGHRHSVWNWLVPMPLYALSLALFTVVFLSMPVIQKMWTEQQAKMRAAQATQLADAVKSGTVKQTDADQTLAAMDSLSQPRVVKSVAMVGGFGFGMLRVFWWAFVLWFLARAALKVRIPFGKALEVAGLTSIIALVGNIAVVALTVNFGKTFSDGGFALSVTDFESTNHQMLVAIAQNALNFWFIAVLGTGLARLTGMPWIRSAFMIVTYWIASEFLLLLLGLGFSK
jgi:hypothetical protein